MPVEASVSTLVGEKLEAMDVATGLCCHRTRLCRAAFCKYAVCDVIRGLCNSRIAFLANCTGVYTAVPCAAADPLNTSHSPSQGCNLNTYVL